jgi:dUTP pyrophosphatase
MELRFTVLSGGARLPTRANSDDAGLDLYAAEAAAIAPAGGRASIATGLAVEIPPGHAGLVLPRSGLAARHGVTLSNAPGLIDPGYRGELRVLMINTDPSEMFEVAVGERVAQLLVCPLAEAVPVEVDALSETARAEGGFGSSGR